MLEAERTQRVLIVVGAVFNANDEILLSQRFDPEFEDAHLRWELPGGKHEPDETLEQTCEREVLEETGYKVEVGQKLAYDFDHIWQAKTRLLGVTVVGFRCKLLGGKSHLNDHKVNDMKWVRPTEIGALDLLVGTKEFIDSARQLGLA